MRNTFSLNLTMHFEHLGLNLKRLKYPIHMGIRIALTVTDILTLQEYLAAGSPVFYSPGLRWYQPDVGKSRLAFKVFGKWAQNAVGQC